MVSEADVPAHLTEDARLLLAQKVFADYYLLCFWSMPEDFVVTAENLGLVIDGLRLSGGHQGWKLARALCP
jgi:hypothetical protein